MLKFICYDNDKGNGFQYILVGVFFWYCKFLIFYMPPPSSRPSSSLFLYFTFLLRFWSIIFYSFNKTYLSNYSLVISSLVAIFFFICDEKLKKGCLRASNDVILFFGSFSSIYLKRSKAFYGTLRNKESSRDTSPSRFYANTSSYVLPLKGSFPINLRLGQKRREGRGGYKNKLQYVKNNPKAKHITFTPICLLDVVNVDNFRCDKTQSSTSSK